MDIAAWLRDLGLEQYERAFLEQDIDADVLPQLTADDLIAAGVASVGHRRKLLSAIAALHAPEPSAAREGVSPLAPALERRGEAERRQLTVLFCDLVGSTELSARLDPEEMREVIGTYQANVAKVVRRWDGHLAKYMGDGALAYFGWPQAHEDDAERAVRTGLELVQTVAALTPAASSALQVRVGIATGNVVVGDLGGQEASDKDSVVGETPNLAARLQSLAEPGSVVISQTTRRLVGGVFEIDDLGPQRLKGFAEPLAVWRVSGQSRAEGRFDARHTTWLMPLVGREEEIALLLRRWQQAKEGEGQVVLLSGEPGIGKSRLVRELRTRFGDEPHLRLTYQCSPHHTTSPLHPVIQQLERAAGFERDNAPENKLDKLEALLARGIDRLDEAVPLIAALLGIPIGDRYTIPKLTPQRQKQLTLEALADQLEGLSAEQPVLLVHEDVHWIDPTAQELLDLVIERIQSLPVLAIITFRPEFIPPWTGLPHVSVLALTRLGRRDGATMVEQVVGIKALPDEVSAQIVAKTDGVPLFVEELTKTVLESGLLKDAGDRYEHSGPLPPLAIPSTLHDSLLARLDRLAPVKEVAQIGAAIGREFPHELLAAVADRPEDQLNAALDQLVSSELVFRRGTPPEVTYSFKHALVQDAAYGTLLKSRRQHLHARILQALEEQFSETAESQPELLAHHCTRAGLAERAIDYWHKAGQLAVGRSATAEAVAHLTHGLEMLEKLPECEHRDRKELGLQVTLGVALFAAQGQGSPRTGHAYARAGELARQLGEVRQLLPILFGQGAHYNTRADFAAAREATNELLRVAEQEDDLPAQVVGHRMMGLNEIIIGAFASARTHLERAVGLYDPREHQLLASLYAQDPGAPAFAWLAWSLAVLGYSDQALSRHREARLHVRDILHPNTLAQVLFCGCTVRQLLGHREAVRDQAEALSVLAKEQKFPFWRAMATVFQGWALALEAGPDRSSLEIRRGLAAYSETAAEIWVPYFLALLADVHVAAGQTSKVLAVLNEAIGRMEKTRERWFEAELHRRKAEILLRLSEGDKVEAEAGLHKAIAVSREQQARLWELRAATSLARLWAERGERRRAYALLTPVYGWFTEGFDTQDLKHAKALLDDLQ